MRGAPGHTQRAWGRRTPGAGAPDTAKSGSARSAGSRSVGACAQTSTTACGAVLPFLGVRALDQEQD